MTAPCPSLAFCVVIDAATRPGTPEHAALLDAWAAFLDRRGLCVRGGGQHRLTFTVRAEASQATENDRQATREWLASRAELRTWHVGELEDLTLENA